MRAATDETAAPEETAAPDEQEAASERDKEEDDAVALDGAGNEDSLLLCDG